jgi:hypothetical protein
MIIKGTPGMIITMLVRRQGRVALVQQICSFSLWYNRRSHAATIWSQQQLLPVPMTVINMLEFVKHSRCGPP